jgi:pyrophosphatase PpaX
MKPYKHIFFDWDGCVADTLGMWFSAIDSSLDECRIRHSERDVLFLLNNLYTGAMRLGMNHDEYGVFKKMVYEKGEANAENVRLYEGAEQLLGRLKAGGKSIALISSGSRGPLDRMLRITGARWYFDLVVSGSDVENRKPDPEGIALALAKLGSEKNEAIMVGDSDHDLEAARNAGIDSVLFYPDTHSSFYDLQLLKTSRPTYTVSRFDELARILILG